MTSTDKTSATRHFSLDVPFHSRNGEERFEVDVFEAKPRGPSRGCIVVIQEIFGVNEHVRSLARHYAEQGFTAWAPAFFDPIEKGIELSYDEAGFARGREIVGQLGWDKPLATLIAAAALWTKHEKASPIACIGFCWGGSLAYLAATRLKGSGLKAGIAYYGSKIYDFRNETAQLPLIMHFGEKDKSIPHEKVNAIRDEHPELPIYVYPADHGFNRDVSHSYDPEAAALAWKRTELFLREQGF